MYGGAVNETSGVKTPSVFTAVGHDSSAGSGQVQPCPDGP